MTSRREGRREERRKTVDDQYGKEEQDLFHRLASSSSPMSVDPYSHFFPTGSFRVPHGQSSGEIRAVGCERSIE
ncbi:hypothetical protein PFISCL1PPCAC_26065, partial [Pristionchus fissidentatus]